MSKERDLPAADLREYAAKVWDKFEIYDVGDETIDYPAIERHPSEIAHRRALLRYLIPDVFAPGTYNHRADVIDGCLYFLETLEKGGHQNVVYHYWAKRAGVRKIYYIYCKGNCR